MYVIDEIKMNDIFFLYNKKISFCINILFFNSISFYNLYFRLKEVMKYLNLNKYFNGIYIFVISLYFKIVLWKLKVKFCYYNLFFWIFFILYVCN